MDEKRIFDTERVIPTYFRLALSDFLSAALALVMYRLTFPKEE